MRVFFLDISKTILRPTLFFHFASITVRMSMSRPSFRLTIICTCTSYLRTVNWSLHFFFKPPLQPLTFHLNFVFASFMPLQYLTAASVGQKNPSLSLKSLFFGKVEHTSSFITPYLSFIVFSNLPSTFFVSCAV